jgi:hypothetical protein
MERICPQCVALARANEAAAHRVIELERERDDLASALRAATIVLATLGGISVRIEERHELDPA